jgi:cytochrome c553
MLNKRLMFAILFGLMLLASAVQAGGDAARGQELAADCADCHGDDGQGDEESPALAGLDEAYHVEQLKAFKSGERVDEGEMMGMYAEDLSEQDMADLAAYYATK